eukprot:TRINITY_DN13798_c0_g1_i1.p1 TRINITY_DN13798_c0_g1~~TRINITY_DN13798_c0_g1_i1.p1  ORF type:complete len:415 (+),score=60.47 TRINITY_DN13798_c0_g1_i1:53-1297(+)
MAGRSTLPPPVLDLGGSTPPCTPRFETSRHPETPRKEEGIAVPQRSDSPEIPKGGRRVKTKLSLSCASITRGVGSSLSMHYGTPECSPLAESGDFLVPSYGGWFNSQFRVITEIGKGNFGHVVEAVSNLEGMHYAVKVLNTTIKSQYELSRRVDEAKVLARCNHTNIIRYYSCWVEEKRLYLQSEYCPGGSLDQRVRILREQNKRWDEDKVRSLLLQTTSAADYLHTQVRVAHLDIKPENIYISGDQFKLGDFGHAHFLDESMQQAVPLKSSLDSLSSEIDVRFSLEEGDIRYLPLEMLNDKTHLTEADIFSLGMSVYEVLTGSSPPRGAETPWRTVREASPPSESMTCLGYSPKLAHTVTSMMRKNPTSRPSAQDVLTEFQEEYLEMLTASWRAAGACRHTDNRKSGVMAKAP